MVCGPLFPGFENLHGRPQGSGYQVNLGVSDLVIIHTVLVGLRLLEMPPNIYITAFAIPSVDFSKALDSAGAVQQCY